MKSLANRCHTATIGGIRCEEGQRDACATMKSASMARRVNGTDACSSPAARRRRHPHRTSAGGSRGTRAVCGRVSGGFCGRDLEDQLVAEEARPEARQASEEEIVAVFQ